MEVYTLDALLRREGVIDTFESLIWTERWAEVGDFELVLESTIRNRRMLIPGTKLVHNDSNYVAVVETIEDKNSDDGRRIFTAKGRLLESILEDRVAKDSLSDLTTSPAWVLTGTPAVVARKIFHDICVSGTLSIYDKIPFIFEGTFLAAGNIPEISDPIRAELSPTTVLTAIQDICKTWNLGFRLIRQGDLSKLWFDIYPGSDRTTKQTVLPPVVFTPELDNLENVTELTTVVGAKNVAYVYSPAGFQMVYANDVDPEIDGFDRHVLTVEASDITSDNPDVASALIQRGKEELAKNRAVQALDGEISPRNQYKYGIHYNLGDLVEQRNIDGVTNDMRVSEYIFVSDKEGDRSYPTFSLATFINTGSWLSWLSNKVWADMGATEYWADQP